jgi:hypothetical protein
VRDLAGQELSLPSWDRAVAEDWLGKWAMNLMLINVSTEGMSVRELHSVADATGVRAARTARKTLIQQVATKITNMRGYRSLRDGANER